MGTRLPVTLLVLPSGALLLRVSALKNHSWCVAKEKQADKASPRTELGSVGGSWCPWDIPSLELPQVLFFLTSPCGMPPLNLFFQLLVPVGLQCC